MIKNQNQINYQLNNSQQKLTQYKKNMKIFIQQVQKQISLFIDKYENQIKLLKEQILKLKHQLQHQNTKLNISQNIPLIKQKNPILNDLKKPSSNLIEDIPTKILSGITSKIQNTQFTYPTIDSKLSIDTTHDKYENSQFQISRLSNKRKQEDLINSLENGKANLYFNTNKMLQLVGKMHRLDQNEIENQQIEQAISTDLNKNKLFDDSNTSLGQLYTSISNSFHVKRAQTNNAKKRQQKSKKYQHQLKKQNQLQFKKKQQGIKNMLIQMRKNIESSPQQPQQIIHISTLLSTSNRNNNCQYPNKTRVGINPVPIDITNRNKDKQQNSPKLSPFKNPPSILKNSLSGPHSIFSKSIQNISTISLHESEIFQ